MRRLLRALAIAAAIVAGVLLLAAGYLYAASERRLTRRYTVAPVAFAILRDSASVAHGKHLFEAVTPCALCHGADAGGNVYMHSPAMGTMAGPNLTRGHGSAVAGFTPADWDRAVRHGVRQNGTSLIVMPSEVFTFMNDADLGAIVGYLESAPPVDRQVPRSDFGPVGRALLGAGKLSILVAPKVPHVEERETVPAGPTAAYGHYLASVTGCLGCHGFGLSGGRVAGPPGLPPASNLTPTGIGTWTEADFRRAMREGVKPGGAPINEFMPWKIFRNMTDDELTALWLYLKSVPPREFGNK